MSVITRFAPSPTGYLHIGGARTALFNYLFAAHHGGSYRLRIEDTDRKRSTAEAIDAIYDGLDWLGLTGDGPAALQSANAERHRQVALAMLERGTAYKCFLTPEDLEDLRQKAQSSGDPVRSPWRSRNGDGPHGQPFTVRLRMPDTGQTEIADMVQGKVNVQNDQLDDLILLRSDATPTYMLAVVVDDHDMNISHIIRGDDHLNNAFRQYHIYQAAGWDVPVFGHIPLIHGPDGAKLSKRHGALGIDAWREMGYLPEAMVNYLARLGWSHGDDELFSLEQAVKWFDGTHIGRSPSRFDFDKLKSVNNHWLRNKQAGDLADLLISRRRDTAISAQTKKWLTALMPLLTQRAQTLTELDAMAAWLFHDGPPVIDEQAAVLLDDTAKDRLSSFYHFFRDAPLDAEAFQDAFAAWMTGEEIKMKDIGLPLRAALTGTKNAPSIIDILLVLGRKEVMTRLEAVCHSL